jgi:hypothetical protein
MAVLRPREALGVSEPSPIFTRSLDAHTPHALHGHDRAFRETNCYTDLWIEVLHALGLDPLPLLSFTLATDFEGDQWTMFKPPHADVEALYGIRVDELALYRPLLDHVEDQVGRGRLPLLEVDSFFLPDTAGTDYQRSHVKTTIAITAVDREARRVRYFHNASFVELEGDDFDGLLRVGLRDADGLPPYCEIVKLERTAALPAAELRARSAAMARRSYARRPLHNPVRAHAAELEGHVSRIVSGGMPAYHAYCFAAIRQLGASFELAATYLRWLDDGHGGPALTAADAFTQVSATAKMLVLKLARIAEHRRARDLGASFSEMASAWDRGMEALSVFFGP